MRSVLNRTDGPAIVCAQAGNVNTGAFDPLREIETIAHAKSAWLHIDGAFGLWAAAAPSLRHLVDGAARADSWTVDGHKWLNVPYDSGFVIVAHPAAHAAAMTQSAAYLLRANDRERDCQEWTPEASRRARGTAVYAALRSLGRRGLDELVTRCCRCAGRIAARLGAEEGVDVLNEVVLNQVLVRFRSRSGENISPAVAARFQREGVCWAGGTEWRGEPAVRISVSAWKTTDEDVDRSVESIVRAHAASR